MIYEKGILVKYQGKSSECFQLLFLIFSVKIFGEAAERISVPSVMGEILAGASLGVFFHNVEIDTIIFLLS